MYVYVISAGERAQKIGLSRDADVRFANLQTAHHTKLELVFVVEVADAAAVERYAHQLLQGKRLRGEWFAVHADQAISAVNSATEAIARGELFPLASETPPLAAELVERAPEAEHGGFSSDTVYAAMRRRDVNSEMYRPRRSWAALKGSICWPRIVSATHERAPCASC